MKKYFIIIVCFLLLYTHNVFAIEPILITISSDLNEIQFDGKWNGCCEWKHTSLNTFSYDDGTQIELRSAHQGNFIYVFVDAISDTSLDKGADNAMICFDSKNTKSVLPNKNDFCFTATVDRNQGFIYQGGYSLGFTRNYAKIDNQFGFIGIGGVSDVNDRYTEIPHTSYEFKIPTDLIGRSDTYGFYLALYDAHSNKFHTWPNEVVMSNLFQVPNPTTWGEIISPDKSLPEFELPTFMLFPTFVILLYITKFWNKNFRI